jgi:hypothetical protein
MYDHFDDEPAVGKPRGVYWWQVLLVVLIAVGFTLTISFRQELLPPTHPDRFTRQLREDILAGADLRSLYREFDNRKDREEIVARLAGDPDPRVRITAAELLMRHEVTVKAPIIVGRYRLLRPDSSDEGPDSPVLRKLLTDPDSEVRQAAIRSVTSLARTHLFESELLHILWNGPEEERLLVCRWLGHWNGREALKVFSSPAQTTAVRSTVFRGIQTWRSREFAKGLEVALAEMLAEPDPQIRLLAVEATRWVESPRAVEFWYRASRSPDLTVARQAVEHWIAALVEDDDRYGLTGNRLPTTLSLLGQLCGQPNEDPPNQLVEVALLTYVLCEAANGHAALLASNSTNRISWHIKHIVQPLIVLPRELAKLLNRPGASRPTTFTAWLPHELRTGSHPPTRRLAEYVLDQLKKPAQWCEAHRDIRGLRELDSTTLTQVQPDTLGDYLDFNQVGSYHAVEQRLKKLIGDR